MKCDHVLGISESRLMDKNGNQRLEWKDEVLASSAGWNGDGLVNLWWQGSVYRFCPKCGVDLGVFSVGLRPAQMEQAI